MTAEIISVVVYARMFTDGGFIRLIAIAGGVMLNVCVAPVTDIFALVKHGHVASGHTETDHRDPIGVMAVFDGMLIEYAPLPFNVPVITLFSVPPVQV